MEYQNMAAMIENYGVADFGELDIAGKDEKEETGNLIFFCCSLPRHTLFQFSSPRQRPSLVCEIHGRIL